MDALDRPESIKMSDFIANAGHEIVENPRKCSPKNCIIPNIFRHILPVFPRWLPDLIQTF